MSTYTPSTVYNVSSYDGDFVEQVQHRSQQNLTECYQCGNCTAGCPVSFTYDYPVSRIMRLLQAGRKQTVLTSHAIWLCASCETCTTRCPNDIDVARIMDVLRHMAADAGHIAEPAIHTFWDSFLKSVERNGRVFEVGLMAAYMTRTGRFLTDADLAPTALSRGKLGFVPHTIKAKTEVRNIFKRYREQRA